MRSEFRRKTALPSLLILFIGSGCGPTPGGSATVPAPQDVERWRSLHQSHLDERKTHPIDLLFLGDSLTEMWNNNPVWIRHFGKRNSANFGIGGDRTQHLLWRIDDGELDGITPRLVILEIGTNNLASNTPEEIFEGIKAIVDRIRRKLPSSKILLLGIFPRGANRSHEFLQSHDEVERDNRVQRVNRLIAKLADGEKIVYLDLENALLSDEGRVTKTIFPDFLHLSEKGYEAWANAIEPWLGG